MIKPTINKKTACIILPALLFLFSFLCFANSVKAADYDDLYVEEISVSPSSPAVSQDCVITVKIKNSGTKSLYTSKGTNYYNYQLDNFTITKTSFTPPSYSNVIAAGGYLYYTIEGEFSSAGEKNLTFTIDTGNELTENNENNNSVSKKVTVVAAEGVDLSIQSISLSSTKLIVNNDVTVTVAIENSGTVSLTSSSGFADDDVLTAFSGFEIVSKTRNSYPTTNSPLAPGSVFKYIYSGKFTKTGDNALTFQVDRNGKLSESNENNNSFSVTKTVYLTTEEADSFSLTDVGLSSTGSTTVNIKWTTSKETTGKVTYKEKIYETLETEAQSSTSKTAHEVVLSGLKPATSYYYRVIATYGSVTQDSGYREFTTLSTDSGSSGTTTTNTSTSATNFTSTSTSSSASTSTSSSASSNAAAVTITNDSLYAQLKGKIILKVESKGEAYYVNPEKKTMYSLGRPADAFEVMRGQGIGITNANLAKIPLALDDLSGTDTDADGLPDAFEDAIGSDKTKTDSDNDGYGDKEELAGDYSPIAKNIKFSYDDNFAAKQKGKIFLQTEGHGEAWYVNPTDGKRYFLGRPSDAFNVMRNLGLGVSNSNFEKL